MTSSSGSERATTTTGTGSARSGSTGSAATGSSSGAATTSQRLTPQVSNGEFFTVVNLQAERGATAKVTIQGSGMTVQGTVVDHMMQGNDRFHVTIESTFIVTGSQVSSGPSTTASGATAGTTTGGGSSGAVAGGGVTTGTQQARQQAEGAQISVNPTSGPPGTQVTVDGTGFAAREKVSVYFDGLPATTSPEQVESDPSGGFTATMSVPSTSTGMVDVLAADMFGNAAITSFNVTSSSSRANATSTMSGATAGTSTGSNATTAGNATSTVTTTGNAQIMVSPTGGLSGDITTVVGSGFQPSSRVSVELDGTQLITATTDVSGQFTAQVTIPTSAQNGQRTVSATDSAGNTASAFFTVNQSLTELMSNSTSSSSTTGTAGSGAASGGISSNNANTAPGGQIVGSTNNNNSSNSSSTTTTTGSNSTNSGR